MKLISEMYLPKNYKMRIQNYVLSILYTTIKDNFDLHNTCLRELIRRIAMIKKNKDP